VRQFASMQSAMRNKRDKYWSAIM